MAGLSVIFVPNNSKLSPHTDQRVQRINDTNHKIHAYGQTSKNILKLVSKKGNNNDKSSPQLSCLQNSLLMGIFKVLRRVYITEKGKKLQGNCVHLR